MIDCEKLLLLADYLETRVEGYQYDFYSMDAVREGKGCVLDHALESGIVQRHDGYINPLDKAARDLGFKGAFDFYCTVLHQSYLRPSERMEDLHEVAHGEGEDAKQATITLLRCCVDFFSKFKW